MPFHLGHSGVHLLLRRLFLFQRRDLILGRLARRQLLGCRRRRRAARRLGCICFLGLRAAYVEGVLIDRTEDAIDTEGGLDHVWREDVDVLGLGLGLAGD